MKKLIFVIIILYSFLYYIYPNQHLTKGNQNQNTKNITLPYEKGKITLNNFKVDKNERYWGIINNTQYMIYKGIDKYILINGEFYQVDGKWINNEFVIPEKVVLEKFHLEGQKGNYKTTKETKLNICQNIGKEEVLKVLKNPNIPINQAAITKMEGQLPGAGREYRNGKHEGFDWYPGSIGIEITRDTKVNPIFEGRIVRIDKQFKELEPEFREKLLQEAADSKNTSQETLDKLRGKQVWVQSKDGILVHYAHLTEVNTDLKVGDSVKKEDWVGKVGNSGTSNGALGTDDDLHLHSDILVCGKNFWEYGEISDMNTSVVNIFDQVSSKTAIYK